MMNLLLHVNGSGMNVTLTELQNLEPDEVYALLDRRNSLLDKAFRKK